MEFMQSVESIEVPVINSSKFQVLCHAEAEAVVEAAEAWLRTCAEQSGCEDPEGRVEKVIASKIALLACQFYPHSPDAKVTLTLSKIMLWFFVFDDLMDDPSMLGADSEASQQFCGFILQAFFSGQASQALVGVGLLPCSAILPTLVITLLVDWWAELRVGMSTRQQARFCSHFSDYVLVHARQARFKEDKRVPEFDEYLRIRMVGGAMYVVEMLAETDSGIELDEEELKTPCLRRLNEVMGMHAGLLNDYVGLAHEYETGDYFNLLTVLHYRNNRTASSKGDAAVPFQIACTEAWEIIRELEEKCVESAKVVQEWALAHSKPGLFKYVAGLCSISASNWLFCVCSPRFTAFNKHLVPLQESKDAPIARIVLTPYSKLESNIKMHNSCIATTV